LSGIGQRTSELIEQRVLAELTDAFTADAEGRGPKPPSAPPRVPQRPSVADEIQQLRELRDSGALTKEQYARAVDRALQERS
jgi:hypothetical protein